MHLLSLLGLSLTFFQTTAPAQTFATAPNIAEPNRIELTPKLDGVLSTEEWDPFSNAAGVDSYLQWEPRKVHIAAKLPANQDLLVSLDMKSNGWLVGRDNLEVRVHLAEGKPVVTSRLLDATAVAGPRWIDIPGVSSAAKAAAKVDGDTATIELTLEDPGIGLLGEDEGNSMSVRVDGVPADSGPLDPFVPRLGAKVKLVTERATAMPVGLRWNAESAGRVMQPGDSTRIRVTFNGKNEMGLKRLELRCEGSLADQTNALAVPFPEFDKKGRAFVDYETKMGRNAEYGYHILRGSLSAADGSPALLQTSFRVAPLLDFDLQRIDVHPRPAAQKVKFAFYLKSNTARRLDGQYTVAFPEGWELKSPGNRSFVIYNSRAGVRRVLEVVVPAQATGTFPIKFSASIGDKTVEETRWITID